jgi:steroid delta-isomerase
MADDSITLEIGAAIDATIDGYLASFGANDRAAYVGAFAPDGWLEDPVGSPRRVGPEAIGGFWDETRSMADALDLVPMGFRVVTGNEAVLTLQARPVIGGQTFALDIVDHMTFDDTGKIVALRAFFDPSTMAPLEG